MKMKKRKKHAYYPMLKISTTRLRTGNCPEGKIIRQSTHRVKVKLPILEVNLCGVVESHRREMERRRYSSF